MIKRVLEKQSVFDATLRFFAWLAQKRMFSSLTQAFTSASARLNLLLNKPDHTNDLHQLAKTWQELMPQDGQEFFKVKKVDEKTAFAEIHLHCPLRGTGDNSACYKLMNYDRKLMESVGGQLVVLNSQAERGRTHCSLAIRRAGDDISDLSPAHLAKKRS